MVPFIPSALYTASTVYVNDAKQCCQTGYAREILQFVTQTIKRFQSQWKIAHVFLAQLLSDLKECNIDFDATPADPHPLECWDMGTDSFDEHMGPKFSSEIPLDNRTFKTSTSMVFPPLQTDSHVSGSATLEPPL